MFPSSTSSSKTLQARGLDLRAAVLAAGLLVVVEAGIARQEWIWHAVRGSEIGLLNMIEEEVIPSAPEPTILLMGSSRMRDAIPPRTLEGHLGLAPGGVLNLGIASGTPFEALTLYRRNREKLSAAKVLVISAEDWYANGGIRPGDADRRFSSLQERLTDYPLEDALGLLVGWVWRTYDARYAIERWLRCHFQVCEGSAYVGSDNRVLYRRDDPLEGPPEVDVSPDVRRFYQQYDWSLGRLRQLERLIAEARADGLRVIVVQFPFRDEYLQAVRTQHATAYAAYVRAVRHLAGAEVLVYESADGLGISQRYFRDYGHLTPLGAEIMAQRLAEVIADTIPEPRPAS
jgi:hypothetical protein